MRMLTVRVVRSRESILKLLEGPGFGPGRCGSYDVAFAPYLDDSPKNDHCLCVFVYAAESQENTTQLLHILSTTVVGIQRYTTSRLRRSGSSVWFVPDLDEIDFLAETLRAHFRWVKDDTHQRIASMGGRLLLFSKEFFPNGAGDSSDLPELVMRDPDMEQLETLLDTTAHDTESESGGADDE